MSATLTYPREDNYDTLFFVTSSVSNWLCRERNTVTNEIPQSNEVQTDIVRKGHIQEHTMKNWVKMEKFRSLEENWNGYGAEPLEPLLIDKAQRLIRYLDDRIRYNQDFFPEIFPTAAGCIQLEFEPNDDYYFEIEIYLSHFHIFTIIKETEKSFDSSNYEELIGYIKEFKSLYEAAKG